MLKCQTQAYMNELHQDRLQVTEGGSSLHTETQLLLKVTTKGNLKCREKKNVTPKLKQKQQMQIKTMQYKRPKQQL